MSEVAGHVGMPHRDALAEAERCRRESRLTEADAVCRRVLEADPNSAEAEHMLGIIAHQNGKLGAAIGHLRRAIVLNPESALYHANLGEMLRLAGRPQLAVEAARQAIAIDPAMAAALSNLGVALYELNELEEAASAARRAIAAKPDFAEAHCNLGSALQALRRFDEAAIAYRTAIALKPNYADAWANLGTALRRGGEFDDAMVALRRAIALVPDHADAHAGLGILLLMRGEFGEGWDENEWRLRSSGRKVLRFPENPWQGDSLAGKHICVLAEQGLVDSLQFARYLPLVAARAAAVTLRVPEPLVALLCESFPGVSVVGERGEAAPHQCDAMLLSLPRLLRTRRETIPAEVPYLRVPAQARQRWTRRLAALQGLKVGLAWSGDAEHVDDHRRAIEPTLLAPLFDRPGVSFVSLQRGAFGGRLAGRALRAVSLIDLAPELGDFVETAGAIEALDLVVTVDTAVAHLAGALGKPVWMLTPWVADWRWMLEREDSPWYPTMRLFRQRRDEAWTDVIAWLADELSAVVAGDTARLTPFASEGARRAAQAAAILAIESARVAEQHPRLAPSIGVGQALILAEQKRRQGFLADAEELVRRVSAAEPNNAEAVHLRGVIVHQSGKTGDAIAHLRRAVALDPTNALFHANLGEMCRLAGLTEEAVAAGRRALAINPDYPAALNNLGVALFEQGKFEEALAQYDHAIALEGDFAPAHSNRANALQRLNRFAEAEPAYHRALELQPNFINAWNNLGTCMRELKRPEDAEVAYRRALALKPDDPDILNSLALTLKDLERLDEAADKLRQASAIEPRRDKYHLHYAAVLLDQHKVEEAAAAVERARAINPDSADLFNLLGRIAFERGDLAAALAHYRHALSLKPELIDTRNNMGNVFKELGRIDEARDAYAEVLARDPRIAGAYVNLGEVKSLTPGDLAAMEQCAAQPLSARERIALDFALAKGYADIGDDERALAHFIAGNAAKRARIAYDEATVFDLFDRIESTFTSELMVAKGGRGDPARTPIFIIGMPRSGTTLIEQIIASHPLVYGAGELQIFDDAVGAVCSDQGAPYPDCVAAFDAAALQAIAARYLARVAQRGATDGAGAAVRVTDKMPSNYFFAGLIHLALPNASIVHVMRDPFDTCMSCFTKLFIAGQNHTYALGEIGRYYRRYQRLMRHWRRVLPPHRILDVRYEDVVGDLEGQARRLIAHCGLGWDDRCLAFHLTERPVRTASASQVRQPIYASAIGRWRAQAQALAPLREALGVLDE